MYVSTDRWAIMLLLRLYVADWAICLTEHPSKRTPFVSYRICVWGSKYLLDCQGFLLNCMQMPRIKTCGKRLIFLETVCPVI